MLCTVSSTHEKEIVMYFKVQTDLNVKQILLLYIIQIRYTKILVLVRRLSQSFSRRNGFSGDFTYNKVYFENDCTTFQNFVR